MRTSFKKLTSIFLAVLMVLSAFSVMGIAASAAETDKVKTGGSVTVDVSQADDPENPSSWFAWTWNEGEEGHWVSGYGEGADAVHFDDLGSMVKFVRMPWESQPDWNGTIWNQTGDLAVEGDHLRFFWTDNYGEVGYEWGGNPGPGPDPTGDPIDPPVGDATVYLDPGEVSGSWSAWSYAGGEEGSFVSGSEEGGVIKFDGVASNVIFVNTSDGGWSGRTGQTAALDTVDGATFKLDGSETEGDDGYGNPIIMYGGEWSDAPVPTDETEEPTEEPTTEEPTTEEPTTEEPTQAPTDATEETTPAVEETTAEPTTEATEAPTTTAAPEPDDGPLTAIIKLNGVEIKKQEINGDTLKVTYKLTANEPLVDGQAVLTYNKDKLTLESWEFPVVDAAVIDNLDEGLFNFASVKKPFDFSKGDVLVVCNFKVKAESKGNASVDLKIEELDSADTVYAANSEITAEGKAVVDSMKGAVDVDAGEPATTTEEPTTEELTTAEPTTEEPTTAAPTEEPTTAAPTEAPTTTAAPTEAPTTAAPTVAPTTVAPTTVAPATAAPTKAPVKKASSLKGNPNADSAVLYVQSLKNDKDPAGSKFGKLKAKAAKVTKNSVKVTWSKVSGAKKYIVMGNKCGSKYKKLKTTSSKSFTQKGLKKGTYYKYMVLAVNGKNKVIGVAKTLHVATKGGSVGNYKSVKITNAKSTFEIKKGKKFTLKAKGVKADKKVKNHRAIKFEASNNKVKVTASGKISAKKKGTVKIYAYAQNGVYATLKVKVK
ncbi:MAG: fibronectin type III domain-containing protein [Ruminococcus sp.]|nr:fibronectin type III domain-containing protein [Ruminococcus sp.]